MSVITEISVVRLSELIFRRVVQFIMLGVLLVLGSLLPARGVVIFHLSMQKMALESDIVVLCEELELHDNVIEYPAQKWTDRIAVARCRPLRVFKGALESDKEFTASYTYTRRRPSRKGFRTGDGKGRIISETPSEYFPAGKALLFLKNTDEAGVYVVMGAKLIQNDEVFDLGGDQQGIDELRPQQQPENSLLGECLKYGEAELVADYMKGMAQLDDPALPQQFRVPFHKDPLVKDPLKIQAVALTLSLIPALLIYVGYRVSRFRRPKSKLVRVLLGGLAVVAAGVLGVHAHAVTTIWGQRPVRWERVRTGMTPDDLRCFVRSSERRHGYAYEPGGEQVMLSRVDGGYIRGTWQLRLHYDVNRKVDRATIYYHGNFRRFVPSIRLD